jgi:hypothetical protein
LPIVIGAAALVVLLAAVGVFLATRGDDDTERATRATDTDSETTAEPDESTTTEPDPSSTTTEEQPAPASDRISSGALSYQALGGEWEPYSGAVLAMEDAVGQSHLTQENTPTPGGSFIASVLIGSLAPEITYAGPDDLEAAALALTQILVTISGAYPDGTNGEITAAEPVEVDGHQAFLVRVELTYDIDGLNATGETVRIAVIDTAQGAAAFWGSVPNDAPQLVPDMEAAFNSLTVDE